MFGLGVFRSLVVLGPLDCMSREIKPVVSPGMVEISLFFGLGANRESIAVFGHEFTLGGIEVPLQDYGGQVVHCLQSHPLSHLSMTTTSGVWHDGESGQLPVVRYKGEFNRDEAQGKEEQVQCLWLRSINTLSGVLVGH